MRYYFDTSALLKRYIKESGSEVIDDTIDKAHEILVSALTHIEAISALRRLLSEGKCIFRSKPNSDSAVNRTAIPEITEH